MFSHPVLVNHSFVIAMTPDCIELGERGEETIQWINPTVSTRFVYPVTFTTTIPTLTLLGAFPRSISTQTAPC